MNWKEQNFTNDAYEEWVNKIRTDLSKKNILKKLHMFGVLSQFIVMSIPTQMIPSNNKKCNFIKLKYSEKVLSQLLVYIYPSLVNAQRWSVH